MNCDLEVFVKLNLNFIWHCQSSNNIVGLKLMKSELLKVLHQFKVTDTATAFAQQSVKYLVTLAGFGVDYIFARPAVISAPALGLESENAAYDTSIHGHTISRPNRQHFFADAQMRAVQLDDKAPQLPDHILNESVDYLTKPRY
jgi:hypothetical protein